MGFTHHIQIFSITDRFKKLVLSIFTSFLFMSNTNMLRGYSLKKSPLNIQNAKDYEGAERTIQDDEGNSEDWWGEYQNPIHNELSTVIDQPEGWTANKLQRSLKKDANEPGWASGVDDLARVLLDTHTHTELHEMMAAPSFHFRSVL